jgi:hypothetical protein
MHARPCFESPHTTAASARGRGPAARTVRAALVCLAGCGAVGCDVRDEQVGTPSTREPWPRVVAFPHGPLGDPRQAAPVSPGIEYVEGYEAGSRQAAAAGLPLLLVFRASWCRWSGEIARGPLADPAVVARSRRLVCVTVDADRDAATCRAFGVTAFPTVMVIDADGQVRHRATGAEAAVDLATALERVLGPAPRGRVATEDRRLRSY